MVWLISVLLGIIGIYLAGNRKEYPTCVGNAKPMSLVISGCSSGIGKETAQHFAEAGFFVYAGVRALKDGDGLNHSNIMPILLDVTNTTSIKEAVSLIAQDTQRQLVGVVNNAGIGYLSAVEEIQAELLQKVLDVNLFGVIRMTQEFLPLLRQSRCGRIVNIGSISGILASPLYASYSISKFGLEALSDTMRMELGLWNISVSVIEPGTILDTSIRKKNIKETLPVANPSSSSPYDAFYAYTKQRLRNADAQRVGDPPSLVAAAVVHAMTSPVPYPRYVIGRVGFFPCWLMQTLAYILPVRIMDALLVRMMTATPQ